jgi:hypothetical protein
MHAIMNNKKLWGCMIASATHDIIHGAHLNWLQASDSSDDRLLMKRKKEKKQCYRHVEVQRYRWYQQITSVHVSKKMAEQIGTGDSYAWAKRPNSAKHPCPLPSHLHTGSVWNLHLSY